MDAAELDTHLEELEIRLERLRALYEQYFLGIEKIEPSVARKDVDRRIYVLRREKIRNTAKRFKLQTIIQRYNTFQQYWQRICREIENGTYKRHLLRAERTYGTQDLLTIAARKRLGRPKSDAPEARSSAPPPSSTPPSARPASQPRPSAAPRPSAPPRPSSPPRPSAPPRAPGAAPQPPSAPGAAPRPGVVRPPAPSPAGSAPRAPAPPARAPLSAASAPKAPAASAPKAPASRPPRPAFESLDLDMDFLGDWDPAASRKPSPPKPAAPASPSAAKPVSAPEPSAQKPAAPAPAPAAPSPRAPASTPGPSAAAAPAEKPTSPGRPGAAPSRSAEPDRPASPRPQAPVAASPARQAPAAARPRPRPAPTASPDLSEERIRALHGKLNELKKLNREEGQVSLDGLTRSLRATQQKLLQKHAGRRIDFDVVIKDGKAVVKPIVR